MNPIDESSTDVLIVGAGPVGLVLANALGKAGVRTLVLERNSGLVQEPRAVSLDDEALRILQSLDLVQEICAEMLLEDIQIGYYDGAGKTLFRVAPSKLPYGYPRFALFFQPTLEKTLLKGLARYPHVAVRFSHEVERISQSIEGVQVHCQDVAGRRQELRAQFLVGCDGGKSMTRSALGISLKGFTYDEKWLVVDALGAAAKANEVSFYCDPQRPAVNMPLPRGHSRWEFLLLPGETEEELLQSEKIQSLLSRYLDPSTLSLIRKKVYTFHARIAARFYQGRVFLAGDAAHVMPPFIGQGLCSGLRDAQNLSWKLSAVVLKKAHPSLLETYEQERSPHVKEMVGLSMRLGSIMMQTLPRKAAIRDFLIRCLIRIPCVANSLREMKIKKAPKYNSGFIMKKGNLGKLTGTLLPQPLVKLPDGSSALLDELLGHGFSLIGVGVHPSSCMTPIAFESFSQLGVTPFDSRDMIGAFGKELDRFAPSLLLVRPDRFVAAHFRPDQSEQVLKFLNYADSC